jgi:hypothetical protein
MQPSPHIYTRSINFPNTLGLYTHFVNTIGISLPGIIHFFHIHRGTSTKERLCCCKRSIVSTTFVWSCLGRTCSTSQLVTLYCTWPCTSPKSLYTKHGCLERSYKMEMSSAMTQTPVIKLSQCAKFKPNLSTCNSYKWPCPSF